jgi:predicted nucleic acid-binding protein
MLDSTAAVAAERQGKNARQLLEAVARETGDEGIAISVVTVLELAPASPALTPPNAGKGGNASLTSW